MARLNAHHWQSGTLEAKAQRQGKWTSLEADSDKISRRFTKRNGDDVRSPFFRLQNYPTFLVHGTYAGQFQRHVQSGIQCTFLQSSMVGSLPERKQPELRAQRPDYAISTRRCSRPCTMPAPRSRPGARTMTPNAPLPPRLADARRVRPDLHPATGPDAAQPAKLRASPRCPTRPNGQNSNPESRSRWIKVGGNVTRRRSTDSAGSNAINDAPTRFRKMTLAASLPEATPL